MGRLLLYLASLSSLLGIAALLTGLFFKKAASGLLVFPKQAEDLDRLQVLKRLRAKSF